MPEHPSPWDWHQTSAWSLLNHCPQAYVLTMGDTPQSAGYPGAHYTLGPFRSMERVSVTLRGDDGSSVGITQGIRVCDTTMLFCGALNMPGEQERVVMRSGTPDFPVYPGRFIVIDADCHGAIDCPPAGDLEISELEIGSRDDTPPTVIFPAGGPQWRNADFPFEVSVDDADSGVHRVVAPGLLPEEWNSGCADIDARVVYGECGVESGLPGAVDTSAFAQGSNTFDFTAFDAAGHSTTRQVTYKFDSVAPPAPADLRAVGDENAWLPSPRVELNWRNVGETVATSSESGLASVTIDIDPAGSESTDPPPITRQLLPESLASTIVNVPGEGRWIANVSLADAAGNTGETASLLLQVDPTRPPTPKIWPIGTVGSAIAPMGMQVYWPEYTYGRAGNCGFTHAINASASFQPSESLASGGVAHGPWFITPEAIAELPDGRQYFHLRAISCAGVPSAVSHEPFVIDRRAPELQVTPRSGWSASDPKVEIIASETGDAAIKSGINRIEYLIDGDPLKAVIGDSHDLVLEPGEHSLSVQAFDNAANASAVEKVRVGYDPDAPDVRIARPAAGAPTELRAEIADPVSGVVDSWIDVRPAAGGAWRRIGRRFNPSSARLKRIELTVSIPDDGGLPDGDYQLRVVAADAAGNATIATSWSQGGAAGFSLPLRPRPELRLLVDGDPAADSVVVDHARGRRISGVLTEQGAAGIAGAEINVVETRPGGVARQTNVIRTTAGGRFSYYVKPEVSRRIEFRHDGTAVRGRASALLNVRTRAGISLRSDRRLLRGGGVTRLTGRIDLSRAALPDHPFVVTVELLSVKNRVYKAQVASDGSFVLPLRFNARREPRRLRFRAFTPLHDDWPFARGYSRVVTLVVAR